MRGIVVCVHNQAAEQGVKVMEAGGNAFDAALTTAFVQMVLLPFSCGVGGMMAAHLLAPAKGEHRVIDGNLRAGSLVTEDMWAADYLGEAAGVGTSLFEDLRSDIGYTSICTPGAVAVMDELHRRYCTLPWEELIRPAIRIARDGFSHHALLPDHDGGGSYISLPARLADSDASERRLRRDVPQPRRLYS